MADSPSSGNEECAARPLATQPIVGWLPVDQEPALVGDRVRRARAVAAALFPHHEHEPDPRLAVAAQPVGGGDLSGQNAFGVAGAAAV